jgi:hypothetical protein
MPNDSKLSGLRVAAFESRRGTELADLITRHGGSANVTPAMREVTSVRNPAAVDFANRHPILQRAHSQVQPLRVQAASFVHLKPSSPVYRRSGANLEACANSCYEPESGQPGTRQLRVLAPSCPLPVRRLKGTLILANRYSDNLMPTSESHAYG